MKKSCELCKSPAWIYCESDQASLCWDCDFKVHGANFLVARHSRGLLCQVCQSPTPWSASGAKLGPTVSVCDRCVTDMDIANGVSVEEVDGEEDVLEFDCRDDYNEGGESDYDEEEDGGNQVVSWPSSKPAPSSATSSSSTSEEESSIGICCRDGDSSTTPCSLKRNRQYSQEDLGGRISRQSNGMPVGLSDGEDETPADYVRPLKHFRIEPALTHPVQSWSPLGDSSRRFPPARTSRQR
ncbi:hypothetical protein Ancab_010964 [Ancistrocladus abbreviatus]